MSETDIEYIGIDTSKKGSESRILKKLYSKTIVPVIPADPEDEFIDSTQIGDQFGVDEEIQESPLKRTDSSVKKVPSKPSTHTSRTSNKY